jgi:Protein of unknown function (DUF4038)/Putative collagen-binding domain of a collagenase
VTRFFAVWSATALMLSLVGLPASAREGGGEAVVPSVKGVKLEVSPNGRYFVDQDDKPFFYLGDTCCLLFQRLNHDEKNAYSFGKFLGERYKNNAVMWYPDGDSAPGQDDKVWVAMAKGLWDGCGGTQLISYHGSDQTSSSTWYHKADWLDFNTIQSGHTFASDSYALVSKDYRTDEFSRAKVQARWYDPRDGKRREIGEFANSGVHKFNHQSHGEKDDWVLVLDASGHDAPGVSSGKSGSAAIKGPLRQSRNPNYFEDATGTPLVLCGSHSWNTLQDWGTDGTTRALDFDAFVKFLTAHGHNFTLLWSIELPRFRGLPTRETSPPDFYADPFPWARTGPGLASDGRPRFDLTTFNQTYFDRLRARVKALNDAGIYAGVYLFTGEWLAAFRCPVDGYPFSGPNNVNGVDDGYRGRSRQSAVGAVTMTAPNAITGFQDVYVKKTIDTLNDLPNVLWIVSEEAPTESTWWNDHLISLVRAYETGKPYRHPVGYGSLGGHAQDPVLYNSDADWVAPWTWVSPPRSAGTGNPPVKVNVNDSDHSYFGMWNDSPQKNRNYIWENFANGNQVVFMDPYLIYYPRQKRNLCASPINGIGGEPDPRYENFRNNLGYLVRYSRKLDLINVTVRGSLSSTKFCLAKTPDIGAEYLVYAPDGGPFTVDLSAMPDSRMLTVEWFNPASGEAINQEAIPAGSRSRSFTPPFRGDAVLYLVDTAGHH